MSYRQDGYDRGYADALESKPNLREGFPFLLDFLNPEEQTEWEEGYEEGYADGLEERGEHD